MYPWLFSLQALLGTTVVVAQTIPPRDAFGWVNMDDDTQQSYGLDATRSPTRYRGFRHESAAPFCCDSLAYGLDPADCQYMASIGIHGQGENAAAESNGTGIWIGVDGPNTFTFINAADVPVILLVWHRPWGDDKASFLSARAPTISYSLLTRGTAVKVSVANDVPGGWSVLYNRSTLLTQFGQVDNTFGEFSTGDFATVDVSRLVKMSGNAMAVAVSGGCVADMTKCAYTCDTGTDTCGGTGSYSLLGCEGTNAVQSIDPSGNPTGGCQGWSNGGHVDVVIL